MQKENVSEGHHRHYLDELRELVEAYLQQHQQLSINSLAKRSGVSTSSLRRLLVNQTKTEIAPHLVLNLVSYIKKEKNFRVLIEHLSNSLQEYLLKHFGSFLLQETDHMFSFDLNSILSDHMKYFIYKMASHKLGTTKEEVNKCYGQAGLKKLGEMLKANFLFEDEYKIRAKQENFSIDIQKLAQLLPYIVSYYRPDQLERGLNLCYNLSESLSEEAIQEIKTIQKEAVQKIYHIMMDPNYWGGHHFMCVLFSETMTSYTLGE